MFYIPTPSRNLHQGIPSDGIYQEFVPHGSILYKVYVVGNKVSVDIRSSMGVLDFGDAKEPEPFDSDFLHALPKVSVSAHNEAHSKLAPLMPLIEAVSLRISQTLKLSLFGWDLIVGEGDGMAYIIDVNYFPKFEGFPHFHASLLQLLIDLK